MPDESTGLGKIEVRYPTIDFTVRQDGCRKSLQASPGSTAIQVRCEQLLCPGSIAVGLRMLEA